MSSLKTISFEEMLRQLIGQVSWSLGAEENFPAVLGTKCDCYILVVIRDFMIPCACMSATLGTLSAHEYMHTDTFKRRLDEEN